MRSILVVGSALSLAVVAGCSNAYEAGSDGGLLVLDTSPPDDGASGTPCGSTTCPVGRVCCNASCGICTLPEEGCVALDCSDAGPPLRHCGFGFGDGECGANEYCDFEDGSSCGRTGVLGVCVPAETDCPLPGGATVCGCDESDYIGECAAHRAGYDVIHVGSCHPPPPPQPSPSVSATATCAPWDGAAWRFVIAQGPPVCTETQPAGSITVEVWDGLDTPGSFTIGEGSSPEGEARLCASGATGPCVPLAGFIRFDAFTASGTATFRYELSDVEAGMRYFDDDVSVDAWCDSERFCG